MLSWILKIIDRLFVVLGALVFSQIPLFIIYYIQQLQGHVSELQVQVDALRRVAAQNAKSLDQYIQKFISSTDPDFHGQGHLMQTMVQRYEDFSNALHSLQHATLWERPMEFLRHFHWEIAQSTQSQFQVGLPLSLEGGFYAAAGAFAGFVVFQLLKQLVKLVSALALKPWKKSAPIPD